MKYGGGQICVQWNLGHVGTRTRHYVREVALSLEVKNVYTSIRGR